MYRKIGIICLVILIITIVLLNTLTVVSLSAQDVTISLFPNPKVDIVLAKSRSTTDVTNFERDILASLQSKGVNTANVKVSSVEAQDVNIQTAFTWRQDVSSSIGSIKITGNGQNVEMKGNPRNPGKNAIWIMPQDGQEQEFKFGYNIDYGDSFNAAGMLLRVQEVGNTLKGYMLSFNKTWKSMAENANGAIWEFSYTKGTNTQNITKTFRKALNINQSGTLNVKVSDAEITIEGGGLSKTTYVLPRPYGNGFGFFSDHYSHACSSIGSFTLTNINLNTTIVKKYSEVLRAPEWRQESIKVLVNVSDYSNDELSNSSALGEIVTRLLTQNIYFTAWGKPANQTEFQNLIKSNNDNGYFINNSNYNTSIDQTATYIKTLIDALQVQEEYVILGDPLSIQVSPSDILTDTADENYPYGKWKIDHDYQYYENHIGQFSESGKYIEDFINVFDKTGKYHITFEDQDVYPENIYVHRRPVAQIGLNRNGNKITLTSDSYDLDSYSQGQNGISEEEWKYKKATDINWTNGKLTEITDNSDYIVQLRVKDFQNTWSIPDSKYITNSANAVPIASFSLKNETITKYDNLEIIDNSYDPAGGTITNHQWEILKGNTRIYSGNNPPLNYKNYGTGSYSISLVVTNSRGKVSEKYTKTFEVIEDEIAPEVIANPIQCDWQKQVTVHLEFTDQGGSEFKSYQYAITDSQTKPSTWSSNITKEEDDITINAEGIQYLHIIAQDNAGNLSEDRVLGPYKIDATGPSKNITYSPTDWTIDDVIIHWSFSDDKSGYKNVILPNGENVTQQTGDYIVRENGNYTFKAYDRVGNETTVTVSVTNIDRVSPEGILSLSTTDLTDSTIQILWDVEDKQSGFSKIVLPNAQIVTEAQGSYDIDDMGTYTFIVYDKVGNEKELSIQVNNVDRETPELVVTQKENKWVNEPVILNWEAYDSGAGLKEVVLPDSKIELASQGQYIAIRNGIYTFMAYDKIGNGVIVRHEVSNIDVTPPTLKLEQTTNEKGETKIVWKMEDNQSGIKEIIMPNGKKSTQETGSIYIDQTGIYTFLAYDKVGNESKASIFVIK